MNSSTSGVPNFMHSSMLDSKSTVAEILSSMTVAGPLTPTTLASGGTYSTGIFTGTTPTLTPTTIHNIEQTFFDLQGNNASSTNNAMIPSNLSGLQHYQQPQDLTISRHSGFIPPIVEPINSIIPAMVQIKQEVFDDNSMGSSEQDYFGGASTLGGGSKRQRTHADGSYIVPNIDPNTYLVANSRRPTGPRKMKRVDLTPEEEVKRHQRRERNKWAAAKCRNKREDITNRLINETEDLEEEKANYENEIQSLLQQKEQLEFLLESHKSDCHKQQQHPHYQQGMVQQSGYGLKAPSSTFIPRSTTYQQHAQQQSHMQPLAMRSSAVTNVYNNNNTGRPNTLPITRPLPSLIMPSSSSIQSVVTESLGIAISTPSTDIPIFNFDAMIDGHTGLTPTTGIPSILSSTCIPSCTTSYSTGIPSYTTSYSTRTCATQQRSTDSSSSNELNSPTLISL